MLYKGTLISLAYFLFFQIYQLSESNLQIYPRLIQLQKELRELQEEELDIRSGLAKGEIVPHSNENSFHLNNAVLNYSY